MRTDARLSILVAALTGFAGAAQATTWTGATNNDWLNGDNWSPADAPNTNSEVASFGSVALNNAPSLSANTTIGRLEYLNGAGVYTVSGSKLTIDRTGLADDTVITHAGGNVQVINSALDLKPTSGAGGRGINVAAGSTLTLAGIVTAVANGGDTNVSITGGGVLNLTGGFSGNQIQQNGSATLNVNFAAIGASFRSFDPAGRINFNASTGRGGAVGGASSGNGRIYITTDGVSVASSGQKVFFRGGNAADSTVGVDIAGGGTGTYAYIATENSTRTNAAYRLASAAGNVMQVNNLEGGAGAGSRYSLDGPGVVRFSGSNGNTTSVPILVNTATLELNKPAGVDAIGAASALTISAAGTVKLLASEQIHDAIAPTLAGTFNSNGLSESVAALTLSGSPVIDMGNGASVLTFASLADFGSSLTINNWSGLPTGGGTDRIIFTDTTGWTPERLAGVTFAGYGTGAQFVGSELVPVPEPASLLATVALAGLGLRRRRS